VSLLAEQDIDVNKATKKGDFPLHLATTSGNVATVRVLLQHGAQINARDNNGRTPLHVSCFQGNVELTQLFLVAGAQTKDKSPVQLVVDQMADVNIHDENRHLSTPLATNPTLPSTAGTSLDRQPSTWPVVRARHRLSNFCWMLGQMSYYVTRMDGHRSMPLATMATLTLLHCLLTEDLTSTVKISLDRQPSTWLAGRVRERL
jgi:hypothetical protein